MIEYQTPPPRQSGFTASRNARNGLWLFAIYVALYAGFMGLTAFEPSLMQKPALAGVSLAVIYGFALIIAALALALVYMILCRGQSSGESR